MLRAWAPFPVVAPALRRVGRAGRMPTLAAAALAAAVLASAAAAASRPAVRGRQAMVVTPDAIATAVGRDVLRNGGNAVDASVAVAAALAVTYPVAGNLGGGGQVYFGNELRDWAIALPFSRSCSPSCRWAGHSSGTGCASGSRHSRGRRSRSWRR